MDRETKKKENIAPEQEQNTENNPKAENKVFQGLRRALAKVYEKTEPARKKFIEGRNSFCYAMRSAFDSVAAFFLRIWTVIGPTCKKIGHAVAVASKAVWKVLKPLFQKLLKWIKPGVIFLGNKIKEGAAYLADRFKGLNKAMQIGIGAVSASLVLLIIALMVSSHASLAGTSHPT